MIFNLECPNDNKIFALQWTDMSRDEQAKYYEKARMERQKHMQMYPHLYPYLFKSEMKVSKFREMMKAQADERK